MREHRERFNKYWEKDEKTLCWMWTGGKSSDGYGAFQIDGKVQAAHRVAWQIYNGSIPKKDGHLGGCVCHTCDNRACVNPDHMFVGSHQDNMDDMMAKKRNLLKSGERGGLAKLREVDVINIRGIVDCYKGEHIYTCYRILGDIYGVSHVAIREAAQRRTWRHVA